MPDLHTQIRKKKKMVKHTMYPNGDEINSMADKVKENRNLMVEFCLTNELRVVNTMYRKRIERVATYRRIGVAISEPIEAGTHEQLDYIVTTKRWRNSITDAESDTGANIDTDHYPVTGTIRIKLRGKKIGGEKRHRYMECSREQRTELNEKMEQEQTRQDLEGTGQSEEGIMGGDKMGQKLLPKERPRNKASKQAMSEKAWGILRERGKAFENKDAEEFARLSRELRKQKRKDKSERVLEALSKDLDIRDRWLGIRELKSKYNPTPYHNRTKQGEHVKWSDRAQKAAEYLSSHQWGKAEASEGGTDEPWLQDNLVEYEPWEKYDTTPPTMKEIKGVIKKLKRRKAAGPDEIPVELLKEMNDKQIGQVREILVAWWNDESIKEEHLRARVVLIFKKGDTNKFENYRPISLLNTLYKVFAAILQKRISAVLDKYLQKTQFGFRKDKSTADAIHLVRRVIEFGESTTNQLHLLLLDWEKAFDKVDREELFGAMERMGVEEKIVRLVRALYKETKFKIEFEGQMATGYQHRTPESPHSLVFGRPSWGQVGAKLRSKSTSKSAKILISCLKGF